MSDIQISRRSVTVTLAQPVVWFEKPVSEVRIEEPSAKDLFDLGDPSIAVFSQTGAGASFVDVPEVLSAYVRRCVKIENAETFLMMLGLKDGKAIKRALLGFFHDAPEPTSG